MEKGIGGLCSRQLITIDLNSAAATSGVTLSLIFGSVRFRLGLYPPDLARCIQALTSCCGLITSPMTGYCHELRILFCGLLVHCKAVRRSLAVS
jgi:hypothetical protein